MRTESQPPIFSRRPGPIMVVGCLALLVALAALSATPAAAVPPRPTMPPPTALPTCQPRVTPRPGRTLIVLLYALPPELLPPGWQTLWTGVQWQDGLGAWHDVEGWRGHLDEEVRGVGKKTWVVADGHLGHGPFRWLVYARQGGEVVAVSRSFYLPSAAGDIYEVRVGLPP